MHRVASSWYGAVIAPVGHASRHRVQVPHRSTAGSSTGRSSVVSTSPSSRNDPACGWITHVFLPIQPTPARAANSFSITGTVSTPHRVWHPGDFRPQPVGQVRTAAA